MKKEILLLNDKNGSLLSISFTLRCARYIPLLFHEPEELVNWAKIYSDSVYDCLLLNGCSNAAVLERLHRLLYSCDLDLQILIVGDGLPQKVQDMAEKNPQIICCKQEVLIAELKKFQQFESTADKKIDAISDG